MTSLFPQFVGNFKLTETGLSFQIILMAPCSQNEMVPLEQQAIIAMSLFSKGGENVELVGEHESY